LRQSFSYTDLEARIEREHPLRAIREIANTALAALSGEFEALYSGLGRPSIPPEKLLRATLLQAFSSVRSERQLMDGEIAAKFFAAVLSQPRVKRLLSSQHCSVDGTTD
jgi:transposase